MFFQPKLLTKLTIAFLLLLLTSVIIFHQRKLWGQKDLQVKVKDVSNEVESVKQQQQDGNTNNSNSHQTKQTKTILTPTELSKIAESVTVRIFAQQQDNERGGSGVLIESVNGVYLVITNNHVVSDTDLEYQIETHTGKIYPAEVIWQNNQNLIVDDLAILKFSSQEKYQTIQLKEYSPIRKNQMVFASGFPFQENLKQ